MTKLLLVFEFLLLLFDLFLLLQKVSLDLLHFFLFLERCFSLLAFSLFRLLQLCFQELLLIEAFLLALTDGFFRGVSDISFSLELLLALLLD